MANSDKEIDWGTSSESIKLELVSHHVYQDKQDRNLKRFKDYALFIIVLLMVLIVFFFCIWRLIENPDDKLGTALLPSIVSGFIAYLVGKKL